MESGRWIGKIYTPSPRTNRDKHGLGGSAYAFQRVFYRESRLFVMKPRKLKEELEDLIRGQELDTPQTHCPPKTASKGREAREQQA